MLQQIFYLVIVSPLFVSALYIIFKEESFLLLLNRSKNSKVKERFKISKRLYVMSFVALILILDLAKRNSNKITLIFPIFALCFYLYEEGVSAKKKAKRIKVLTDLEFPALVEIISVLISAGESPVNALKKVCSKSQGALSQEFKGVISAVEAGKSLTDSLSELSFKTESNLLRRFCDTVILALERGTSLSDILAFQVQEVRSEQHALLMGAAGKAEINLMIPVIFLILPVSILFALWPSYLALGRSILG